MRDSYQVGDKIDFWISGPHKAYDELIYVRTWVLIPTILSSAVFTSAAVTEYGRVNSDYCEDQLEVLRQEMIHGVHIFTFMNDNTGVAIWV